MKKKRLLTILISLVSVCTLAQGQNIIRGNVCDEEGRPMVGANIYIYMVLLMGAYVTLLAIFLSKLH